MNCHHTPRDEHFLLDVGQKQGVVLAGQVQTLSMETQDLQTVQHVEQDVRLLKLGHFLNTEETRDSMCTALKYITAYMCISFNIQVPAEWCI